jgi:ribosomal protein L18E
MENNDVELQRDVIERVSVFRERGMEINASKIKTMRFTKGIPRR